MRCLAIVLIIVLLSACTSSNLFTPLAGPLLGSFVVAEQSIGTFSITTADRLVSGTGTLIHNAQTVTVAISAVISGTQLTGTVTNASLGSGEFVGQFIGPGAASGTFNYTDAGAISTTSGTWLAQIE